jgi:First Longin domain of FUZ, MON1 and HPS1
MRWRSKSKHFFVLSSAGKPVYSRFGDDGIISGYTGVIQAIISFFEDHGDTLKCELPWDEPNEQKLRHANAQICDHKRNAVIPRGNFLAGRV